MSELFEVILVDDDADDRFLFQEAFEELKVATDLRLFSDGQEFIDHLESGLEKLPQLIFLDLNMPIKNGIECLRFIRKSDVLNEIFVAIYSTSSAEKDVEDTFINGANIYIKKPNEYNLLMRLIDKVVKMAFQNTNANLNRNNFMLRL